MENYIKDQFEEFKADGIICTKKEKYYLITLEQIGWKSKNLNICYNHIIICGRWKTNSKKLLEGNFNKLDRNEIDPTITELIKNFNSALNRGLKDRYWEEIHMKALRFRIY